MYTEKERKELEKALKKLEKCGGVCNHCEKCHIYTAGNEKASYMAVGCDLLPSEHFTHIANVPSELHAQAIELLQFELKGWKLSALFLASSKNAIKLAV